MNLLPQAAGSRPRLACEIFTDAVVAARSPEPGLPLAAVGKVALPEGAILPGLKPGNIADRVATIAGVRRALEAAGARANARGGDLTLVIPDAAVRVLLLDFDSLPAKLSEALPIVRFRLKKLVPFDTETAMVSFQVMSSSRSMIRVLALAIPRDVLSEYESVAREAGFEPGAVLPSTLAALAGLNEGEGAALLVNAGSGGVTTAIVRAGIVLLHRSVELMEPAAATPANLPAALFDLSAGDRGLLPLVDRDATEAEWAAQEPLPEHGRNPYADRQSAERAVQAEDSITGLPVPSAVFSGAPGYSASHPESAPVSRSPYASPSLQQQLDAQFHNSVYLPPSVEEMTSGSYGRDVGGESATAGRYQPEAEPVVHTLAQDVQADEIARAVSVAVAFFEDNLAVAPTVLLSAGPLGADALGRMLRDGGVATQADIRVRELTEPEALAPTAVSAAIPRSWLAGVAGALRG